MKSNRILIVEDDHAVRAVLVTLLKEVGYEIKAVSDGPQAVKLAKETVFNLYLIDLRLPSMSGIEVLQEIRKINSQAICVVLTAYATIELSVKAMKAGAFDFISKPFQVDVVLSLVKNALEFGRLKNENYRLQQLVRDKYRYKNMAGNSLAMQKVYDRIERVADSDSTALIQGESGTGKEIVAKTIHFNSARKNKPLIPINCGAIPEALLESELFGHEKGAFTGATTSRTGRFELAHGGTIFFDEVGEMPIGLQVKLLRVLQEREFERVGGTKSIQVDVRIIAATNQDLEEEVREKRFREDLFYRLNVIPINIPPLRERKEDLPLLIDHFLRKFNERKKYQVDGISPEAQKILMDYRWPGNIRELENLIERMIVLKNGGMITSEDIPSRIIHPAQPGHLFQFELPEDGINFSSVVTEFENKILDQAMSKANGVKNRAAQLLKMNRTTLVERLKRQPASDEALSE
ncbi:MAG: sigma-54-dependent transcriptional regulator [Nitrospiria bacterium]